MTLSNKSQLAIFGGNPSVDKSKLKKHNPISKESIAEALSVLESGRLSEFVGEWCDEFYGGSKVLQLERESSQKFGCKYAVTVNSWTSGLVAAIGAIGVEPGDEIITTPYTMSATATAILHWNAIPVFVDIDAKTFNIDVKLIEGSITDKTRAILIVDIYGQPADIDEINAIARKHKLKVITDSAQSPGAKYKGLSSGTLTDIGGYSFNFHKHIHSGEGGVCFTNNDEFAENLQLIRNHAEAVVAKKGHRTFINMLGHNFRMGELEAAILIPQLKTLDSIVARRVQIAKTLTNSLANCEGLITPYLAPDRTHSFYTFAMQIPAADESGVSRKELATALKAEGIPVSEGYQNIHMLPLYQNKIAYGSQGFPWRSEFNTRNISYEKGICPVAENFHDKTVLALGLCTYDFSDTEVEQISSGFRKVWSHYF
jgi:perosamine synthetase